MKMYHPIGNKRIYFIKSCEKIIKFLLLLFLSFFLKINRNKNEIIISSAFTAPWKEDKEFSSFHEKIKDLTLLDSKRLYTLWYLARSLRNTKGNIFDQNTRKKNTHQAIDEQESWSQRC